MNWEAIGAFAELLAAFGALGALVFLGFQIRQNTRALQGNSFQALHTSANERFMAIASNDELIRSYFSGEELSPDALERGRFNFLMIAVWRAYENYLYQYETGLMDEALWAGHRDAIKTSLRLAGHREWIEQTRGRFHPSLYALLEELEREIAAEERA